MCFSENDPSHVIGNQLDQLEMLVDQLEQIAITFRDEGMYDAADEIMQAIRDQRFQAMLVRGLIVSW